MSGTFSARGGSSSSMSSSGGLRHAVEIIPRTLFWLPAVDKEVPINLPSSEYDVFSIDDEFVYERFFADFGPLHLGSTVRFCRMVEDKLEKVKDTNRVVVLKCGHHKHLRTNSALLIGIFCIVALHKTADEAYLPFVGKSSHFIPYRDAAFGLCTYNLTVIDTLRGVEKSVANGFFQYSCFNVEEHERLQQIEHGDVNWIQPGKLLAFSGPFDERRQIGPDRHTFSVDDYVPLFKKLGVTCVIRFNKKCYDRRRLLQKGISHVDLFYEDGGNPTDAIMYKFIEICEREKGAVAVHCKAGLGRTGTNIGAYMMKHYKYTADEFIGWCRICRPGSVVGPQQQFLADKQPVLWKAGDMANRKKSGATNGQESFKAQSSMSAVTGNTYSKRQDDKRYLDTSRNRKNVMKDSSADYNDTNRETNDLINENPVRVSVSQESKASSSSESSTAENRPMNSRCNSEDRKRTKSTEATKRGQPYSQGQSRPRQKASEGAFVSARQDVASAMSERKKQSKQEASYGLLREKSKTPVAGRFNGRTGVGSHSPISSQESQQRARPRTGGSVPRSKKTSNVTDTGGRYHQTSTPVAKQQRPRQLGARFVQ